MKADDWPTYQADASRSGYTTERMGDSFHLTWVKQLSHAPSPAWPRSERMIFDRAFQMVVADGIVFFGSSVNGKLTALDLDSGKVK